MKFVAFCSFLLFLCLATPTTISAQAIDNKDFVGNKVKVTLKNGDEYVGTLMGFNSFEYTLVTEYGELKFKSNQVRLIKAIEITHGYGFDNPIVSRYFISSSAIPTKKGEGYYQNFMIFLNGVNFGVTKNFSIGGGLEFLTTITGTPVIYLTPKLGFKVKEDIHVGVGSLLIGVVEEGFFGIFYGNATFGTTNSNFSAGIGFATVSDNPSNQTQPLITLSGFHRLTKSIGLMSDNFIIPLVNRNEPGYFGVQGIRILSEKNAFDIGLILSPDLIETGFLPTFPIISYSRVF